MISPQGYNLGGEPEEVNPFWEEATEAPVEGSDSAVSPQGYMLGEDPRNKNPFWNQGGEDSDVNRIFATATVDDNVGTPSVQTIKTIDGHDITFGFHFHNLKGRDGSNGEDGADGQDGVSPTITITDITGGHRVSITDASGTHSFDVMNGQNGTDGRDGTDGTDGVSPSVSVSDITGGHRITVTDATGSEIFDVMNGQTGPSGQDGVSPTVTVTSITGGHRVEITDSQGTDAFNVMNGIDGVSPTIDVVTITGGHRVDITDAQGSESFNVMDGQDGTDGQDGVTPDITMSATADATSSANPTVTVTKGGTTANPTFALAFSGLKGEQGIQGPTGATGATGATGPAGPGVPTGGTAGQVLAKVDGTDYNTEWITPSGGGGGETKTLLTSFTSNTTLGAFLNTILTAAVQAGKWGHVIQIGETAHGGLSIPFSLTANMYQLAMSTSGISSQTYSSNYKYLNIPARLVGDDRGNFELLRKESSYSYVSSGHQYVYFNVIDQFGFSSASQINVSIDPALYFSGATLCACGSGSSPINVASLVISASSGSPLNVYVIE